MAMAITTYFLEEEIDNLLTCSDEEINELLEEVNQKTNKRYFIREYDFIKKRFLRPPVKNKKFSLFAQINGMDCQVINFVQEHEWSINTFVGRSYILTYLLGILTGIKQNGKTSHQY